MCVDRQTAEVAATWRRADERLYPMVMVDPERYTRVVAVIRDTADRLRGHQTVEDLVRTRQRGRELVASSCSAVGVPLEHLGDVDAVADAAFALRHREVDAAQRRQRITARITRAHERGDAWVTIDESGHLDQPGVAPYERIDMRLDDGSGLRMSVDVDPDSYQPIYAIDRLQLDPVSGTLTERVDATGSATFRDRAQWSAAFERWRDHAAAPHEGP